jgi:hypothetical protein
VATRSASCSTQPRVQPSIQARAAAAASILRSYGAVLAEPIRIVPLIGAEAPVAAAAAFTYRGGPLLGSVEVVTAFVGGAWTDEPLVGLARDLETFFDFVVDSPLMEQLAEYGVAGTPIGPGRHVASATLEAADLASSVDDERLRELLLEAIDAGTVPAAGANTLYSLLLPPGVTVELGGARSCRVFCGYHDAIDDAVFYAVLPYPDCSGCGSGLGPLAALTVTASHELAEAVTDPVPGTGWYDESRGEIGDVCAWQTKMLADYTVQLEWSNADGACR